MAALENVEAAPDATEVYDRNGFAVRDGVPPSATKKARIASDTQDQQGHSMMRLLHLTEGASV